MSTYVRKPIQVEAVQFVYSEDGLKELKELCGVELRTYGRNNELFAKGWAWIGQDRKIAVAGDYVVKDGGVITIYKEDVFNNIFGLVTGD